VPPELDADGVLDTGQELDVCATGLTRALARPEQVGRAVVPASGEAVATGELLLVLEDQRLVRGEEIDLVQLDLGSEVDAARGHEPQRALDLLGDGLVPAAFPAGGHVFQVPLV